MDQAGAVGPFDGVVFDDPVIAAAGGDHAVLRIRILVASVLEVDSLDPDVAEAPLRGDEGILAGGDFDQVIGGRAAGQADVNRGSRAIHPEPGIRRAADLLHERTRTAARGQAVLRHGRCGEIGVGLQMRHCQFVELLHRLQRFAVHKDQPAAAEIRTHVHGSGIQPHPTACHAGQGEGLVGIGEHRAGELVPPYSDFGLILARPGPAETRARRKGYFLPIACQHLRAFDVDLRSWRGFETDHLTRPRTAARRVDGLAVDARSDDHAFARLQDLGGLVDGAERPRSAAWAIVAGPVGLIVHVVGLRECQRLFPGGILSAVGQARVNRSSLLRGLCRGGGIILSLTKGVSTQTNQGSYACRILQEAPPVDRLVGGLVGNFIL